MKSKIICYCGSLRFKSIFEECEYNSVIDGEIALMPCCMSVDIERKYGKSSIYKRKADEQHKRKIDICDEVFVINKDGYIGESTRSEIDYAVKIGKPVKYLEPISNFYDLLKSINSLKRGDKVRMRDNRMLTIKSLEFNEFISEEEVGYISKRDIDIIVDKNVKLFNKLKDEHLKK